MKEIKMKYLWAIDQSLHKMFDPVLWTADPSSQDSAIKALDKIEYLEVQACSPVPNLAKEDRNKPGPIFLVADYRGVFRFAGCILLDNNHWKLNDINCHEIMPDAAAMFDWMSDYFVNR